MTDNKLINIYAYLNLITGKYVYTGQTTLSLRQRAGKDGINYKRCPYFWNEIQKYGWNNFQGEILTTTTNKEYANLLEWFYTIELDTQYPNGCNDRIGTKSSELTKREMKAAHSEEWKKQHSEFMKRFHKDHSGWKHSENAKRRISEKNKGQTAHNKGKHAYTNGIISVYAFECPPGFVPGRKITN